MENTFNLQWIDWSVILIYFVFVIGIGWALKKYMKNATAFLEAGRSLPAWVTGLAFISANLGALEVIGMAASGAKYGMTTVHFYWVGAIPAMIFLAIFMMPFYYGSKARSVPEYLKLRFDEKTRGFNAFSFAVMTVFASGISMYALALLAQVILPFHFKLGPFTEFDAYLVFSAVIVLIYTYLGGLTSAIYNEVLQFFLIVIGFFPLVMLGLIKIGGWEGLKLALQNVSIQNGFAEDAFISSWQYSGHASSNPMGVEWFGIIMGLGFVLSFGYWCTNFLVVQRAMAAGSMSAARKTPLIGAIPKMFIPFLVIIPGMIAIALTHNPESGFVLPVKGGGYNYDMVIPSMLVTYFPTGVLGLGITALLASFMSGMAGNVSAFNTVWTYDIYQSYINPKKSDKHYLRVGQLTTIFGILVSILTAYVARLFNNVMDFLQLIFAFINAPLFATFLLGMFWKRATGHAAFYGLLSGTGAAAIHHGLTAPAGATTLFKGGWLVGGINNALHVYPSEMAQNFWTAIFAFSACLIITIVISILTKQLKTEGELKGLVYSLTPKATDDSKYWYQKPATLAIIVGIIAVILSILFW
ncbi:MAG: sodium:solute symporter family protein [Bacteroidales bacterium]|nr:sodium:solute symporter family protein [Bacteroidales bacterium]